jgi:hypothetical protein
MIYMNKKTGLMALLCLLLLISCTGVQAAEPVLENVTLTPPTPTKLSKVTFTAYVVGDDIQTVKIGVLECNATTGICQNTRDNVTMQHMEGIIYQANVTLDYAPASYLTYWVYVQYGGQWITLPDSHGVKVNLTATPTNGDGNGNNNGTIPGFEMVFMVAAIAISLIVLGRKRFR